MNSRIAGVVANTVPIAATLVILGALTLLPPPAEDKPDNLAAAKGSLGTDLSGRLVSASFRNGVIDAQVINELQKHPDLHSIYIRGGKICEGALKALEQLRSLDTIQIEGSEVAVQSEVSDLLANRSFVRVKICRIPLSESVFDTLSTERLTDLAIMNCGDLSLPAVTQLASAPKLNRLHLAGVSLSKADVASVRSQFPALTLDVPANDLAEHADLIGRGATIRTNEHGEIYHLRFESVAPKLTREDLEQLQSIQSLQMIDCDIDGNVLERISSLPNLKLLSLEDSRIDHDTIVALGNITSLEYLNLDGTYTYGRTSGHLRLPPMAKLRWLHACSAFVDDAFVRRLVAPRIEFLSVGKGVSDEGFHHLRSNTSLSTIALYRLKLTTEAFNALASLPSLKKVYAIECEVDRTSFLSVNDTDLEQLFTFVGRSGAPQVDHEAKNANLDLLKF